MIRILHRSLRATMLRVITGRMDRVAYSQASVLTAVAAESPAQAWTMEIAT